MCLAVSYSPQTQGLQGSDPPDGAEDRIQALVADPRLDDAIRRSIRGALTSVQTDPVLHQNLKDVGRFMLGVAALYLDATGGLTHRRLRDLSGRSGLSSAGTATALLLRMRLIGYVQPDELLSNGAAKRYRPTDHMTAAFRNRVRIELQACADLDPAAAEVLARLDEPGIFARLIGELGGAAFEAARNPHPDARAIDVFAMRSAGMLIMYQLLNDADDGGPFPPSDGEVDVSIAAYARRFKVSRSHVLTVLRDAESFGVLTRLDGGRVRMETEAGKVFRLFYAVIYLGLMEGCRRTLDRLPA